jgi:DNA-binding HxlR family transcriptional regulator
VERRVYAEVPVRVEYSLTPLGWSATELLIALAEWADSHLGEVEEARRRYDEASRPATIAPIGAHALTAA